MKNLWPNSEHTVSREELFQMEKVRENRHMELYDRLIFIGNIVSDLAQMAHEYRAELSEQIMVYTGQEQTFYSQGYRFNRLYIGDAAATDTAQLKIHFYGMEWTIDLVAGENKVNIPDGATIQGHTASGENFGGILIRSNRE